MIDMKKSILSKDNKISSIQYDLRQCRKQLQSTQQEVDRLNEENQFLEEKLEQSEGRAVHWYRNFTTYHGKYEEADRQLKEKHLECQRLSDLNHAYKLKIDKKKAKIKALGGTCKAMKEEEELLIKQISTQMKSNSTLQATIDELSEKLMSFDMKQRDRIKRLKSLEKENASLKGSEPNEVMVKVGIQLDSLQWQPLKLFKTVGTSKFSFVLSQLCGLTHYEQMVWEYSTDISTSRWREFDIKLNKEQQLNAFIDSIWFKGTDGRDFIQMRGKQRMLSLEEQEDASL